MTDTPELDDAIVFDEVAAGGRLVTLAEVREILLAGLEGREDATVAQKFALEHAMRFARLSVKDARALVGDLMSQFEMPEKVAIKMADLVPQHPDDIRAIIQKSTVTLTDDQVEKILDLVAKYYV